MPCDYSKYPTNWRTEIRPLIMYRAGERRDESGRILRQARCEVCHAENYSYGYRGKSGDWWSEKFILSWLEFTGRDLFDKGEVLDHCWTRAKTPTKPTKIVLTIAHWYDKNPMNCADENLKAVCQYCHLNHDKDQHKESARRTYETKRGLQRLF